MLCFLRPGRRLTTRCVCSSGAPTTTFPPPAAEAWEKRCSMITPSCTITCRLRKSLLATLPLTGRLLGRLLTGCPVTTTNTPPPPACPPPRLSLTPLLWGGRLSGSAHRYSTPVLSSSRISVTLLLQGLAATKVSTSSRAVSPVRGRAQSSPQLEYDLQMHSASGHPGMGYKKRRA